MLDFILQWDQLLSIPWKFHLLAVILILCHSAPSVGEEGLDQPCILFQVNFISILIFWHKVFQKRLS